MYYIDFSHSFEGYVACHLLFARIAKVEKERCASFLAEKAKIKSSSDSSRNKELDLMLINTKLMHIREEVHDEICVMFEKGLLEYTEEEREEAIQHALKLKRDVETRVSKSSTPSSEDDSNVYSPPTSSSPSPLACLHPENVPHKKDITQVLAGWALVLVVAFIIGGIVYRCL